ncbi:protein angel-like [Sitodiplosis mosellana]|uniref:protein angel-like n=1 Tax=Sitodiplosis mosellana TaxID=263140 RepID=UPI002444335B|nr:protein angel-like [Sitodiplosis mosellana]
MNTPTNHWYNQQQRNEQLANCIQNQIFHRRHRTWRRTPYGQTYRYDRNGHPFVLMSYNILAQSLLCKHSHLYTENVAEFLEWPHRLQCIRNEIFEMKPAILCLQEVQQSHLEEIQNALQPMCYAKPLYKKRTSPDYDDGCAIFYDPQFFELIDHHYVEFYQPDVKILDRFNVAIIAKFVSKRLENLQLTVATTHLLYNPRRDDVRTAQLQVLLAELDRMSVHTKTKEPLPIILTGDFNCLQFSAPYRLVNDGHINSTNLPLSCQIMDDCKHMNVTIHQNRRRTALFNSSSGSNDSAAEFASDDEGKDCVNVSDATIEYILSSGLPYNTGALWHYLNLQPTLVSNNMASTYQDKWIMVDYIFYTKYSRRTLGPLTTPTKYSSLKLLANYELPIKQDCHNLGPIPNWIYGSDHYAMASEFVIR